MTATPLEREETIRGLAGIAMVGVLASPKADADLTPEEVANIACDNATALFDELERRFNPETTGA